jgi:hypothetical protein
MAVIQILRVREKALDKSTGKLRKFKPGKERGLKYFGIGMLPDGTRAPFESDRYIKVGQRRRVRKAPGVRKYIVQ